MMNDTAVPFPNTNIDSTIAQHGARRVLVAAFAALFHAPQLRPPPMPTDALNDHLRRDVGLSPRTPDRRLPDMPFRP